VTEDRPLDWTAFGIWLSMLVHAHGENVLRVKGLINVAGLPTPVVVNGVQHIIHPPTHLDRWPSDDTRSRIIFVVRGLDPEMLQRSLAAFNGLADTRAQ
jgi:G3E family GTPase